MVDGAGFAYSHMCSLWPEATASTSPLSLNAREAMGRPATAAHSVSMSCKRCATALAQMPCTTQPIQHIKNALRRTKVVVVDALPGADIPQPDLVVK